MLNKIIISGRLTRDPELRQTTTGTSVCSFSVAVDRDYAQPDGSRETDFVDVVAWKGTGEFVSKWFGKGDQIIVSGRLQIRDWTDRDGNKRRSTEIVAENVYFAGSKRSDSGSSRTPTPTYTDEDAPPPAAPPLDYNELASRFSSVVQVEDGERF